MKHFNRYHLGILPLLSILSMSPSAMQSQFASRSIASLEPEQKTEVKAEEPKIEEQPQVEVKPEGEKPVVQVEQPEVKPEEDKPVIQVVQPDVKPEEEKPVVVQNDQPEVKPEVKPEEEKPVIQVVQPDVKPEEEKPVVQNEAREEIKHPKLESIIAKTDKETLTKDLNLSKDILSQKLEAFLKKTKEEKASFEELSDEAKVQAQREGIESLIKDLIVLEAASGSDELSAEEKEANLKLLAEGKDILETLLGSLEKNEELVAKAKESKEDKPVVADNEEPKKEEEKPVVADKDEPKKEEDKKEVCEADEKNKVLTSQVEELMKQNQQILQTMLGMAQMMISMHQQSQNQGIYQQYQMPMPNPYMYQQPMTAGNWVYHPSGFGPTQQNIFAQPMQQPMQQQMSIYPDQMHQQSQWNLRPSPYTFGDQRFQQHPMTYGSFGNEAFSFNMGNSVPTVTQL